MKIEMLFPLMGSTTIPVDHGHGLYGALKRISPELESLDGLGIHTLRGMVVSGGHITIHPKKSYLRLRLGVNDISAALPLAGKRINVLGSSFHLGAPQLHQLLPSTNLWARMVTMKFSDLGWDVARDQLAKHLAATYPNATWEIRKQRTIRIHGKQILGFEVLAKGLSPEDSLRLQYEGVGGRRAFGCGIFVKVGESPRA